ncbi:MarR family winged helix-turn-helix transcriptional regulator [Microbacterium hominis]|uniref:MarR family transcriptional regulator n=1 Tax=Microbacterium hominis TaxID=162426 RepID=A0A7D4PZV4_9MICO|nr:MarR family transcriptional regulator [Microbacterium hominis]QKJ18652.1 MarR family transcriptional regulator [Microbacterium hominis]
MVETTAGARTEAVRALEAEFSELMNSFRRILAERAERVSPGLHPGAYKVFSTIARLEGITLSSLAETLGSDKGQISRAVRELERIGLIERTPDPGDRRSSLLRPTAFGRERLAEARQPHEGLLMNALEDWPVDDIGNLTSMLRALRTGVLS